MLVINLITAAAEDKFMPRRKSKNRKTYACNDCEFKTHSIKSQSKHCCCSLSIRCPGHRMEHYYCSAKCLECGWGGCGCTQVHCCCTPPPRCGGNHQFHLWSENKQI